jgi:hypothetical protein
MRRAKSYSIIDHQFLHEGYFEKLSHESLILYLFLVLVGDKNGSSYWADPTITKLVRLDKLKLNSARMELMAEGLITYNKPYWKVNNISKGGREL